MLTWDMAKAPLNLLKDRESVPFQNVPCTKLPYIALILCDLDENVNDYLGQ